MRNSLTIGEIAPDELPAAAALLARAYRDNPLTLALIGDDPDLRLQINIEIFGTRIRVMRPPALVVRDNGKLAGVCGFDPPGGSFMSADDRLAVGRALAEAGPETLEKTAEMLAEWDRLAPKVPYWHLGPVGVEPALQGRGVGSAFVGRFCEKMDEMHALAYLETDHEANARLYEKFGFVTTAVAPVLGVPMWLMLRHPHD